MIKDFREDLLSEVMDQKSDNRRLAGDNLGVGIQISVGIGNPTQNQAIDYMMILKA